MNAQIKKSFAVLLTACSLTAALAPVSARADGSLLGAASGGATGAAIGRSMGGRDATLIGAAIGSVTGLAIARDMDEPRRYVAPAPMVAYPAAVQSVRYVRPEVQAVRFEPVAYRGWHERREWRERQEREWREHHRERYDHGYYGR